MTTLRKLLLTGNPLRTLRRCESLCWPLVCHMCLIIKGLSNWNLFSSSSLVSGPTPALLKYLRSRLSEGEGMLVLAKHASVWWSLTYQAFFLSFMSYLLLWVIRFKMLCRLWNYNTNKRRCNYQGSSIVHRFKGITCYSCNFFFIFLKTIFFFESKLSTISRVIDVI